MYAFPLDFREILRGNREVLFTYFPNENLLFDGKKCPDKVDTFWFDKELYKNGSVFGEVVKGDRLKDLAEEFDAQLYLNAREQIETYCKVYSGLAPKVLFNLIPDGVIRQYGNGLFSITESLLEKCSKPKNYDLLLEERDLVEDIWHRRLNVTGPTPDKRILPQIMYDMYRGVTGRLNHAPRSFPILSLAKERRGSLVPTNDLFVMYDMKSADFRTFLYMFANDPNAFNDKEDLYADIPGETRSDKKKKVFQTIYSSEENVFLKRHDVFSKALSKISKEDDRHIWINSPFGREIRIEKAKGRAEHLIVSYMIQSITNDITIQKANQVRKMLEGTMSHIAFLIHDCFVVDFCNDDFDRLGLDIREAIQYCDLGRYYWHESYGETFGSMREPTDMEKNYGHNDERSDGEPGSYAGSDARSYAGIYAGSDSSGSAAGESLSDPGDDGTSNEDDETAPSCSESDER